VTPATEVITLHRVSYSAPRGKLRIVRGYCRCDWSCIGPAHRVARLGLRHEQGRQP